MKSNIVYIYADDLGPGMLSCYGQKHFSTPNIDRIADTGVRFTHAYGTAFCAPARACLLTGMHDAHAGRWTFNRATLLEDYDAGELSLDDAFELVNNTGIRPRDGQTFLATVAKQAGLVTAQIGKLEWGFTTSPDELVQHGWDYHYGYYDHGQCHGYYPHYLFENGRKIDFPENTAWRCGAGQYDPHEDGVVPHDPEGRVTYSQDLFDRRIVEFLRSHRETPFLLYHPSQLPHGPTYFPEHFPEVASNASLTPVEREYASMVLRLDRTVGIILDELEELGLRESTMVIFASDNGHEPNYVQPGRCSREVDLEGNSIDELHAPFRSATCGDVFDGNCGLAGLKMTNWEGGVRIPFIVSLPGEASVGRSSDHLISNYDTLVTVADLLGVTVGSDTDGVSFLSEARGGAGAAEHDHIVYASYYGPSLVTADGWKLRTFIRRDRIVDFSMFGTALQTLGDAVVYQLYNLSNDPAEETDVSGSEPARLGEMLGTLLAECDGNLVHGMPEAHFAFYNWKMLPAARDSRHEPAER